MTRRISTLSLVLGSFIALTAIAVIAKIAFFGVGFDDLAPQPAHNVTLNMSLEGREENVQARVYLPETNDRQRVQVTPLRSASSDVRFATTRDEHGLLGVWSGAPSEGRHDFGVEVRVEAVPLEYSISPDLVLSPAPSHASATGNENPYLRATDAIQVHDPVIAALASDIVPNTNRARPVVRAMFDAVAGMESTSFRGLTDAVTAAKLGEASCNGMSRLLVALARHRGIEARLVGGFILEPGSKRTSHQWMEMKLGDTWIPFDALNGHFASLPANYMRLYQGDAYLFGHTSAIDFDYQFVTRSVPGRTPMGSVQTATAGGGNVASAWITPSGWWRALSDAGIPLDVLRVLLLLPLGATVVVLFRNVVGFNTYGTFLPALVAVACLETGLTWGLLGFFGIVALVAALHIPLERLGLLHTPKMAILLVLVVGALLAMAAGSTGSLFAPLTQISFFPVVILAAAAERVATNLEEEEGFETVLMSGATTGIVIMVCYAVMSSDVLARTLLIFPELLLLVVAANLWLGRWIGLRLTEYRRFRWLSPQRPVPSVLLDATRASASSPSGDARASGSSRAAMSS